MTEPKPRRPRPGYETRSGVNHCNRKLSEEQRAEVRGLRARGLGYRVIAERFGVSTTLIHRICMGGE